MIGCTKWTPGVNCAYRRYLCQVRDEDGDSSPAFEIDASTLDNEARYDGICVLRTNALSTPLQAVLR